MSSKTLCLPQNRLPTQTKERILFGLPAGPKHWVRVGSIALGSQQTEKLLARPCCGHRELGFNALDMRIEKELYSDKGSEKIKSPHVRNLITSLEVLETGPPEYLGTDGPLRGQPSGMQPLTRTLHPLLSCPAPPSSWDLCDSTQVHCGGGK